MKCGVVLPGLAVGHVVSTAGTTVFCPDPLARGTDSGSDLQTLQVTSVVEGIRNDSHK